MKKALCFVLCLMLCAPLALAEDTTALDAQFADILKRHKATGAAVVVGKGDEIVYEYYYGLACKKPQEPVTEDTYFRSASVTKLISAIRVMQLVEQGMLDLDTGIGAYLGLDMVNPYYADTPVTLRHLMTHTSSVHSGRGYSKSSNTLQDLFGTSRARRSNFYKEKPGSKYRYSNFGAGMMGSLMEAVTGKNIQENVAEGLFDPLGIDAGYHAQFLNAPEKVAMQYTMNGKVSRGRTAILSAKWDNEPNPGKHYRTTVGSVWIKPRDLCRIGMMLYGGVLDNRVILQPETVAEMCAEQKGRGYVTGTTPYGLCVERVDNLLEGKLFYGHQGMGTDIVANLYFDPDTGFVFALMTNGSSVKLKDHITSVSRRTFELAWETFGQE